MNLYKKYFESHFQQDKATILYQRSAIFYKSIVQDAKDNFYIKPDQNSLSYLS